MRRHDIYHCFKCNCCSDFNDHHNEIFQICICANNFKFFILFFIYSGATFTSFIGSLILLNVHIGNKELSASLSFSNLFNVILFAFLALTSYSFTLIYLQDTLCGGEKRHATDPFVRQLEREYPKHSSEYASYSSRHRFCLHFFGSSNNLIKWIIPVRFGAWI